MTTLDPREDVQSRIDGKLVARMIVEFHRELRDTYSTSVMTSDLCAVGPLQSMIGIAIKNGHLAPSQPAAVGVTDEMVERVSVPYDGFTGDVIGSYTTREGKHGVVVQQDGTRVVHVYGRSRVEAAHVHRDQVKL